MSEQNKKDIDENYIKFEDLEKFVENRKIDRLNESIEELSKLKEELEKFNNRSFFKKGELIIPEIE